MRRSNITNIASDLVKAERCFIGNYLMADWGRGAGAVREGALQANGLSEGSDTRNRDFVN
jgi:hypothetical protein